MGCAARRRRARDDGCGKVAGDDGDGADGCVPLLPSHATQPTPNSNRVAKGAEGATPRCDDGDADGDAKCTRSGDGGLCSACGTAWCRREDGGGDGGAMIAAGGDDIRQDARGPPGGTASGGARNGSSSGSLGPGSTPGPEDADGEALAVSSHEVCIAMATATRAAATQSDCATCCRSTSTAGFAVASACQAGDGCRECETPDMFAGSTSLRSCSGVALGRRRRSPPRAP